MCKSTCADVILWFIFALPHFISYVIYISTYNLCYFHLSLGSITCPHTEPGRAIYISKEWLVSYCLFFYFFCLLAFSCRHFRLSDRLGRNGVRWRHSGVSRHRPEQCQREQRPNNKNPPLQTPSGHPENPHHDKSGSLKDLPLCPFIL